MWIIEFSITNTLYYIIIIRKTLPEEVHVLLKFIFLFPNEDHSTHV